MRIIIHSYKNYKNYAPRGQRRRGFPVFFISLLLALALYTPPLCAQMDSAQLAQSIDSNESSSDSVSSISAGQSSPRLRKALSSLDYPATPGDVYSLSYYAMDTGAITTLLTLGSDYRIKVINLGTINAKGKTYLQLKNEIESLVAKNYPLSGVSFTLAQCGEFSVTVIGETTNHGLYDAYGLTRLSDLDIPKTERASIRFVQLKPASGDARVYDLFLAKRNGDLKQDPYVRPGDVVVIPQADRIVTIRGAVNLPGVYELTSDDDARALITKYAGDVTIRADSKVRLTRISPEAEFPGEARVFSLNDEELPALLNGDALFVYNKASSRKTALFEGAILLVSDELQELKTLEGSAYYEYRFYEGQTLGNAALDLREMFYFQSDLANAYLERGAERIPTDLTAFLYNGDFTNDIILQNNDRIVVPFFQNFVIVSGAVKVPGRYPYIPDRTRDYYINLAGGINELQSNGKKIFTHDINNTEIAENDFITPESRIFVESNKFSYHFTQVGSILTTIFSILSTAISIAYYATLIR